MSWHIYFVAIDCFEGGRLFFLIIPVVLQEPTVSKNNPWSDALYEMANAKYLTSRYSEKNMLNVFSIVLIAGMHAGALSIKNCGQ